MSNARAAAEVLNRDFLEIRARILDLAAALDRVDRASVSPEPPEPRIHPVFACRDCALVRTQTSRGLRVGGSGHCH